MMKLLAILGATTLLAGCSLGLSGKAPPFLLTLSSAETHAADAGVTVAPADAISIITPMAPQMIATTRVPVSSGETTIAYIKDAVWVEPPARLFQRLLSETVRAKTGRVVLDQRQLGVDSGTQLSGQLLQFGIDEQSSRAVIIYDATLSGGKIKTIQNRRFEARVPVGTIDARSAGSALNRAANEIAGEVAVWVAR
jgi:cholesterol transport system auxiliary component